MTGLRYKLAAKKVHWFMPELTGASLAYYSSKWQQTVGLAQWVTEMTQARWTFKETISPVSKRKWGRRATDVEIKKNE